MAKQVSHESDGFLSIIKENDHIKVGYVIREVSKEKLSPIFADSVIVAIKYNQYTCRRPYMFFDSEKNDFVVRFEEYTVSRENIEDCHQLVLKASHKPYTIKD